MPAKKSKSVPVVETPAMELVSDTTEARVAFREFVLSLEDNRRFKPLDMELVRAACTPAYLPILNEALASGEPTPIRVDLNSLEGYNFLRGWLEANGKNRTPKEGHYQMLAGRFRSYENSTNRGYDPSCTHWVVTSEGMVANGGHSARGVALAFFSEEICYGLESQATQMMDEAGNPILADSEKGVAYLVPFTNDAGEEEDPSLNGKYFAGEDGYLYMSNPIKCKDEFTRVGEFDENKNFIVESDDPKYRENVGDHLWITLLVNAPTSAVLKMDDIRLEADYSDFLEMVGPVKNYLGQLPTALDAATVGVIARGWYLRTNGKVSDVTTVPDTFGTLSKGGNLNKSDCQWWFLTFVPMLEDCIKIIGREKILKVFPGWTAESGQTGRLQLKDVLIAMMVSDPPGRVRIAKLATSGKPSRVWAQQFHELIIRTKGSTSRTLNNDEIVETLVLHGLGKKNPLDIVLTEYGTDGNPCTADAKEKRRAWHLEDLRAPGWDRNQDDFVESDEPENRHNVFVSMAGKVSDLLGDDSAKDSLNRKSQRIGKGKQGRNARTKKKATASK